MRYLILTLLLSFSFSECDELNALQCGANTDCEWVEDIDYGSCGSLGAGECNSTPGCNWECGFSHGSCYWCCWYECNGGSYEIDNSYCQENSNPPACSEMSQTQCNNNSDCQWTEDTAIGDCDDINNGSDCYAIDECTWYSSGNYGYGFDGCYGGIYEIDDSYCEEMEYQLGDVNQDFSINVLDVIAIVDLVLLAEYNILADMNSNDITNIQDVIMLINNILEN